MSVGLKTGGRSERQVAGHTSAAGEGGGVLMIDFFFLLLLVLWSFPQRLSGVSVTR